MDHDDQYEDDNMSERDHEIGENERENYINIKNGENAVEAAGGKLRTYQIPLKQKLIE